MKIDLLVSNAIDSILKSIVDDKDEALVSKATPLNIETKRCTTELQTFLSETLDRKIDMHMLSWEMFMMPSSCDSKQNDDTSNNYKRKNRSHASSDKFVNLCALGDLADASVHRRCKRKL